jgi:shikimate dehydrogenase
MRKFGLIGYPLGHSLSGKYFAEKFVNEQITGCSYENFQLTNINQLQKLIIDESDLCGLNVTIPYKSAVISHLDYIDPEAKEIGAVNVLKIRRITGMHKLSGYNSDITGISESIKPYINSELKNALVFGTGGSSRAVCYVLKKLGIRIILISRIKNPGVLSYADLNEELIKNSNLIINTTPLGMFPDIYSKPDINYNLLNNKKILFDLVYNPELTTFLKLGAERGCTIINGIKMLHSQAEKSWEIWNDDSL